MATTTKSCVLLLLLLGGVAGAELNFEQVKASLDVKVRDRSRGTNLVRLNRNSLCDDTGPFLGLGASYFQALRDANYDRARLHHNLAFLASKGFNYVRILSMVSWEGLEIAPVTFTNRIGRVVLAWPDYWQQFRDLLELTGQLRFEEVAGIEAFGHIREILPPDLASWARNDGIEPGAPFTVFCNAQPNRYWPEVGGPTNGCVRNIGSANGDRFVCFPMGILGGGLTLEARRPLAFQVFNPLTGGMVSNLTLTTGNRFALPQGPGAYILTTSSISVGPELEPRHAHWHRDRSHGRRKQSGAWRNPARRWRGRNESQPHG